MTRLSDSGKVNRADGIPAGRRTEDAEQVTAPVVGRTTLVEQLRPGVAPIDTSRGTADGDNSTSRGAGGSISIFDLFGRAVQRRSADRGDEALHHGESHANVVDVAGRGISGAGSPLPHVDRIQASFGRHDVSGVQAHQDAAAASAAHELGAAAYAFGNAAAFDGSPDLHTAAHEAAHVVQQRGGVQLKGGIDQPGDEHERHADAVADAVVGGRSAEQLLDQVVGNAGRAGAAVQRRTDGAAQAVDLRRRAEIYLAANQRQLWTVIGEHARSVLFPDPAARLSWINQHAFVRELLMQLEANGGTFTPLAKLDEILYPRGAAGAIGGLLPSTNAWSVSLGLAIAQALQIAIVSSLYRLGPRYLEVADAAGSASQGVVSPGALVYSMPIDRYVGAAMCTPHALTIEPPDAKTAASAKGRPTALRPAKLAWEGARDPHLWNWVRAIEPTDATVEEVAAALWMVTDHHGETNAAFNAYLLAAAPPLFGIPKRFAIKNPNARRHAPADALRGDDKADTELTDIATSSAADGIALHQSSAAVTSPRGQVTHSESSRDFATVIALLGDCHLQLAFVTGEVARWGLADRVKPAIDFVWRRQAELATAEATTLADWNRVISGQRDRLFKISGAIHSLASNATKLGIADPRSLEASPVREIVQLLATAAGTSHLAQTSEATLKRALELQSGLAVRAVQATERELESAHADFSATMGPTGAKGVAGFSHEVAALQDKSRRLQTTMINGGAVDAAELDEVSLRSGEIALRERMLGTIHSTFELQKAAISAGDGLAAHIAMLFSGKFRDLESLCQHIRGRVLPIQDEIIATEQRVHNEERTQGASLDQKAKHRTARRAVLAKAQAEFAKISIDEDLRNFFREGAKLVENQQFRTACVKAAALIGIGVLAATTGGAAAELGGGLLMQADGAATVAELSTVARVGISTANIVADSAVNAAGQAAVQGGSLKQAFVENLMMSFAGTALFGTIARASAETARLEGREAMTWAKAEGLAQRAMVIGKEAGAITVHTVWGAAIGYVSHRVVTGHEPSPMEARDWLLQGASVAIGRQVHKALGERMPGLERLAKHSAEAHRLVAEAKQLEQLAATVEHGKNAASAVELLDRRARLLQEEIEAIEKIATKDGDATDELRMTRKGLEGEIRESNGQAMLETKFHLLGLEELVPGALWKGSHEQTQRAADEVRRSGGTASQDQRTGRWKFVLDGRAVEMQDVGSATIPSGVPSPTTEPGGEPGNTKASPLSAEVQSGRPQAAHDPAPGKSRPHAVAGIGPQRTADLDLLYRDAAVARTELEDLARAVASRHSGEAMVPPLKGRARAEEKIAAEYRGDASRLTDLARGSVIFDRFDQLEHAAAEVERQTKVVRKKDRFAKPASGYRDILYNIEASNGHVVELQLQLRAVQEVKSGSGHKLYDQIRTIEAKAKIEGRELTDEEKRTVASLQSKMKSEYDAAFAASKGEP